MKILVIEDSKASLAMIRQIIEKQGATTLAAENGHDGVLLFQQERPDLVLLDVILPDIDGFEVARKIRESEHHGEWTPIIFLSSLTSDEHLERGVAAGGDDYIHKPVREVVINAKIRAMQRIAQMRTSLVVLARKLDAANQELKRLSSSDGLTGIANRRFFDETLEREWRRAKRNKTEIALLMCDVDFFKKFNDTYGHQAGDDCLRDVATALCESMERGGDIVARYGGEEFAVVLPDTSLGGALFVAEKAKLMIHKIDLPHAASPLGRVTLSIGIACLTPGERDQPEALVEAADLALYRAKREGRDRVCKFDPAIDHIE